MAKIQEHKQKKERKQREKAAQDKKRRRLVGTCAVCVYTVIRCVLMPCLCIHSHTLCVDAVSVYTQSYVVC